MAVAVHQGYQTGRICRRHHSHQVRFMPARKDPLGEEFGDFQTPPALARQVCKLLSDQGLEPASVVEPTCGIGNFLLAALDHFPRATRALGVEINPRYVDRLAAALKTSPHTGKVRVIQESFFHADWPALLRDLPE